MQKLKLFALVIALTGAFICGACVGESNNAAIPTVSAQDDTIDDSWIADDLWNASGTIIVDPETGVHYIYVQRWEHYAMGVGITPRFNADGTLYTGE